ncbi:MAG: DNA polymerase III subunit delta' [Nitrosomonadaceae bacterium]
MKNIYPWQNEVWQILAQDQASRGHALLLKGRKGIGKLGFAQYLTKFLLCEKPSSEREACENCPSCRWFEQGGHPDFRLVEPETLSELSDEINTKVRSDTEANTEVRPSNTKSRKKPSKQISVVQIRALTDLINMSSHRGGYKIILIHPVETMNVAAANALLKNLEEPPPQTLFILVTHRPHHLLPTIRSRCRQIAMPTPDFTQAIDWLDQQGIKDPKASLALAAVGYAPLAALEYNDDEYFLQHESFIKHISTLKSFNPIFLAEEMQKSDLPTVVNWLQKWCYDLISYRITGRIRYHLAMQATINALVPKIDPRQLARYLRSLIDMQRLSHHPLNPRLFLEEILISYAMLMAPARSN